MRVKHATGRGGQLELGPECTFSATCSSLLRVLSSAPPSLGDVCRGKCRTRRSALVAGTEWATASMDIGAGAFALEVDPQVAGARTDPRVATAFRVFVSRISSDGEEGPRTTDPCAHFAGSPHDEDAYVFIV